MTCQAFFSLAKERYQKRDICPSETIRANFIFPHGWETKEISKTLKTIVTTLGYSSISPSEHYGFFLTLKDKIMQPDMESYLL